MALHNRNVARRFAGTLAVGAACAAALLVSAPDSPAASDTQGDMARDSAVRVETAGQQEDSASASRSGSDGQQRAEARGAWVAPAAGTISSRFGTRWGSFHKGVDIANDVGTPIRAGSSGTIISSGPASGYGLWVRVEHPDNTISVYGHIDSSNVKVGQQVGAGEQIARMGNRGNSTGPHLHYQIEVGGNPVDPERFYADRGARLLP